MTLVDFGVGQSIVKYIASYEVSGRRDELQPILGAGLAIYLLVGVAVAFALFLAAPALGRVLYPEDAARQALAAQVLQITALPLFFSYVNQFFLGVCKAYHRFDAPALIHNLANLGGIIVATLLLLAGFGLVAVLWGYVAVQAVAIGTGYVVARRVMPRELAFYPAWHWGALREIFSFSAYTFLGNVLSSLTTRADKLAVGGILGTEAVTYYQVPFTIAQMANGIVHTLSQIAFPRFSELVELGRRSELLRLYVQVGEWIGLVSLAIAVSLWAAGKPFLALWLSPAFAEQAGVVLQVLALYFFLHSNTVVGYWLLQAHGQAKLTAWIALGGAVAYFAGMYYWGSRYGVEGVAWASFLLLLLMPWQYLWIARQVGHSCFAYVMQLLVLFVLGYALAYGLAVAEVWLNSPLLLIALAVATAVLVLGVGGYGLLLRNGWAWRGSGFGVAFMPAAGTPDTPNGSRSKAPENVPQE